MHNWWIAALEHFGLITRDEAEHISENIRLTIHKDRYREAYEELSAILTNNKAPTVHVIHNLESQIRALTADIEKLKSEKQKTVAVKK
jgi:hypothetical protein